MEPLVSIITPNYNGQDYIAATIESVLAQTYTNWELLIVDDASTDASLEVIGRFPDPRIRVMGNETNLGAALSRNRAIAAARGRYVAFLDGDDLWHPEKLARQIAFMRERGYAFTYTAYRRISADGKTPGKRVSGPRLVTRRKLLRYDYIGCLTAVYDAERIGLVQIADLRKRNDYALWLKVIRKSPCYLLDEELARYRCRGDSISHSGRAALIRHHYALFRVGEGMGRLRAAWRVGVNLVFGALKKLFYERA